MEDKDKQCRSRLWLVDLQTCPLNGVAISSIARRSHPTHHACGSAKLDRAHYSSNDCCFSL